MNYVRTEEGHSIDFRYQGIIKMAPEVKKIFEMSPEAATVPFGFASEYLHSNILTTAELRCRRKKMENIAALT